jgi:hypothetical protein
MVAIVPKGVLIFEVHITFSLLVVLQIGVLHFPSWSYWADLNREVTCFLMY